MYSVLPLCGAADAKPDKYGDNNMQTMWEEKAQGLYISRAEGRACAHILQYKISLAERKSRLPQNCLTVNGDGNLKRYRFGSPSPFTVAGSLFLKFRGDCCWFFCEDGSCGRQAGLLPQCIGSQVIFHAS